MKILPFSGFNTITILINCPDDIKCFQRRARNKKDREENAYNHRLLMHNGWHFKRLIEWYNLSIIVWPSYIHYKLKTYDIIDCWTWNNLLAMYTIALYYPSVRSYTSRQKEGCKSYINKMLAFLIDNIFIVGKPHSDWQIW